MTTDKIIAAARESEAYATSQTSDIVDWKAIAQERFYAIAYRQGLEDAAWTCENIDNYPDTTFDGAARAIRALKDAP